MANNSKQDQSRGKDSSNITVKTHTSYVDQEKEKTATRERKCISFWNEIIYSRNETKKISLISFANINISLLSTTTILLLLCQVHYDVMRCCFFYIFLYSLLWYKIINTVYIYLRNREKKNLIKKCNTWLDKRLYM